MHDLWDLLRDVVAVVFHMRPELVKVRIPVAVAYNFRAKIADKDRIAEDRRRSREAGRTNNVQKAAAEKR